MESYSEINQMLKLTNEDFNVVITTTPNKVKKKKNMSSMNKNLSREIRNHRLYIGTKKRKL